MTGKVDLVIRGGTVADGSGGALFEADIAVHDGRIVEVGEVGRTGAEEIDARGKLVTPGFVDIHTHYDGQATWDDRLAPSSAHGVTTVITGNCGVGFAPCRPADRQQLIELMEGVEDIPEVVMTEGISWSWTTFPDFLDYLGARSYDVDVATLVPHAALRVFVMGDRAARREPSTAKDRDEMKRLTAQAARAGAIGVGTSLSLHHRTGRGDPIPTLGAEEAELQAIAAGLAEAGHGYMEIAKDISNVAVDIGMIRRIVERSGRPCMMLVAQEPHQPKLWRDTLAFVAEAREAGLPLHAQVATRPVGMLMGHELSCNAFSFCASYKALASLPFEQRISRLRDPAVRARILSEPMGEASAPALERIRSKLRAFDDTFPLGDPPNYEPAAERSLARLAADRGLTPEEFTYDLMLEQGGRTLLYHPFVNYVDGTLDAVMEMLRHEATLVALGDGGAHCGSICDASYPTFMLSYLARDRVGDKLPVPEVVRLLSSATATAAGLHDRGKIKVGHKADLNVIDFDRLRLLPPEVAYDFPGGGRRLVQKSEGYCATLVSGKVTYREGVPSGELPGRLVRGPVSA